jgi:hypothetical protein
MRMMELFETADVLGRPLRWAFDGEQLLVVPRAGKMPNAFYHRDSRSLQFFFIDDPKKEGKLVYTCLSPDIVAHETTHAILDGIAPDLYNATSPQSLAMHEAIADVGAVMLAVKTPWLLKRIMDETGGDLTNAKAFNRIADQFGAAIYGDDTDGNDPDHGKRPLRDLYNDITMLDSRGKDLNEPHDLSNVLSGSLYRYLIDEYEKIRGELYELRAQPNLTDEEKTKLRFSISGLALFKASGKLKRIAFRALDYLPPGEISFADYGRAIVAADEYSNPRDPEPRDFIKQEFQRRGIVSDGAELGTIPPGFDLPADLDLEQLVRSDWAAYQFAERYRKELWIPGEVPFEVRPRLDVTRRTWRRGGVQTNIRALIFKVAWQDSQFFQSGDFVRDIAVTHGTTVAIDWDSRKVSTLLTTNPDHRSQSGSSTAANNEMRKKFIKGAIDDGTLELSSPDVQLQDGKLRVRGLGQMLHVMGH